MPRYYRSGPTWIFSWRTSRGLIHLGSKRWWVPLLRAPQAIYLHFTIRLGARKALGPS